jgi:hypothetical protein
LVARQGIAIAAVLIFSALSCQLVVGTDGITNGQCPSGYKACDGKCVSQTDPTYGCASTDCAPCVLRNSYANCFHGACNVSGCVGSYLNCGSQQECLTDLAHDPNNCSGCGVICPKPTNGTPGCAAMQCAVGGCDDGWEDCNHVYDDGCETNLRNDPASCGVCHHACASGQTCVLGVCASTDAGSDAGWD